MMKHMCESCLQTTLLLNGDTFKVDDVAFCWDQYVFFKLVACSHAWEKSRDACFSLSLKSCSPTLLWTELEIPIFKYSHAVLCSRYSQYYSVGCQVCWVHVQLSHKKNSTYATFLVFLTTAMAEAPNTDLWIGATNANGNQFYWTDGRPMNYRNWGNLVSVHYVFCITSIHHVLHF